jgi:branched-chain amino acid transport system ATP-binding protein
VTLETPVLSVDSVTKHFGGIVAVKDLSFEVQAGEILGVMGPNGAGKTTILNVISGTYSPDSGTVKFDGRDISRLPPHRICRLGIARTYQIPQPFANLPVREHLDVAAKYGAKRAAEIEYDKILDLVELSGQKDTLASDLAIISLKRLEVARALASDPTLILLDEVAAGSTDAELPRILAMIREIHDMGKTIVLIEHVMKVMTEAVDRIVVMDKGEKIAEGIPGDIMQDKKVLDAYFG